MSDVRIEYRSSYFCVNGRLIIYTRTGQKLAGKDRGPFLKRQVGGNSFDRRQKARDTNSNVWISA